MKLSPPVLAVIAGAGLLWFMSQRKAGAATVFGATPASQASLVGGYATTPGGAGKYAAQPAQSPAVALIQAVGGLFGGSRSQVASAAALPGQIIRAPDYQPVAVFDSAGESAAQSYYQEHADAFIAVTPDYAAINATPWALAALNDPSEY